METNLLSKEAGQQEISNSLSMSLKLVGEIVEEVEHLSAEFRLGVTPELSMEFDDCLSSIQTLMATMLTLQLVAKKEEDFGVAWKASYDVWEKTEDLFKNSLNAMLRAYGHEDYLGLSDIMEEELIESLRSWKLFVEKVEQNLEK